MTDRWRVVAEGATATIHVRRLDDDVVRRLEQRAAGNDRSLEGEARHVLDGAVEGETSANRASFPALAARLRRETEGHARTPSEVLVREDRETGHRMKELTGARVGLPFPARALGGGG